MYSYLEEDYHPSKRDIKYYIQAGGVALNENTCIRVFTVDKNNPRYPNEFGDPQDYPWI